MMGYLKLLRLYSLVALLSLLFVAGASLYTRLFLGAVVLWIGFLAFLESRHKHEGRSCVPTWVAIGLLTAGALIFWQWEGLVYIALSILYSRNNQWKWGRASPFFRGFQEAVVVHGIVHTWSGLIAVAGIWTGVRNFAGDMRDSHRDRQDGVHTWPADLNWESNLWLHPLMMLVSPVLWWHFGHFSFWWVLAAWPIQLLAYWWIPRGPQKNPLIKLYQRIHLCSYFSSR